MFVWKLFKPNRRQFVSRVRFSFWTIELLLFPFFFIQNMHDVQFCSCISVHLRLCCVSECFVVATFECSVVHQLCVGFVSVCPLDMSVWYRTLNMLEYMLVCARLRVSSFVTHTFSPAVIDQNNPNKFYKYLASNLPMSRWAATRSYAMHTLKKECDFSLSLYYVSV